MDRFNNAKKSLEDGLKKKTWFNELLAKAEAKTKVDRLYMVLGGVCLITLYLIFGYGTSFLANIIGFVYPAYKSIKALETHEKDDDTKWLTYWVVFASFGVVESFTDIFLFWVPFYSLLKCSLFLFLMIPTTNGSVILYKKVIRPYFLAYESKIDSAMDKVGDLAGDFSNATKKKATEYVADHLASKTN